MPDRLIATPRRLQVTMSVVALIMVSAFALAGFSLYDSKQQSCKSRSSALAVIHDILVDARASSVASTPRRQQAEVLRFYDRQLARLAAARC